MKRYIILGALLVSAITQAYADSSYIDSFFQGNYNVPNLGEYAKRQVGQVSYVLVGWNEYSNVQQRYLDGGYVKLGESHWSETGGVPYRDQAISYARFIGADAVVYTAATNGKYDAFNGIERSDHRVGFYAKQSAGASHSVVNRPTSAEATAAINRAQDAWHEPRVKGGVWYDPQTDTYNWTGPKFGERRSKSASWFLDHFGPYL
jgi:hypothetical protein